ncbi:hypothetical protein BBJ28_00012550 [Nothophytophthora sp. Chile5]|nr:hypothetical protein BBJ28_00012550 [Nothophytophthora sp. Chile5]
MCGCCYGGVSGTLTFYIVLLLVDTQLTYWTLMVNDVHLVHGKAGEEANLCEPFCYAIVDTGSSYTYVPSQLYQLVIDEVVAGQSCDLEQLTCYNVEYASFPTLSFSFGRTGDGNFFHLTPRDYLDCSQGSCDIELLDHGCKQKAAMEKSECALCRRQRAAFSCSHCTSGMLQQRRTMLAALQADVAVLRKKTEFALNSRSSVVEAELQLDRRLKAVEQLAERVMKTRERLCSGIVLFFL